MSGIIKLTFNAFQENTYIVYNNEKACWIIDPGCSNASEEQHLKQVIEKHGLNPVALILTHAHIDHIMGNAFVFNTWGLKPTMHEKEVPVFQFAGKSASMWGLTYTESPEPETFIREDSPLMLGDDEFEVLFTPGHSPGEICLYNRKEKYCIAGDVLFYGSIGRTDLPGGNYDTLINSIQSALMTLEDDVIVYSGHGPDTTIGKERVQNPFLK